DAGAAWVAVVDHDRRHPRLRLPVCGHAADVPAVADGEQGEDADAGVLSGVDGARHARRDEPGRGEDVVADRVPEGAGHEPGRWEVEVFDGEDLAGAVVPALGG